MNKDFLTKPISLKDLKMPKINLKNIINNKFAIICIFALIFIVVISIIGYNLLEARSVAVSENEISKRKYNSLKSSMTVEEMQQEINKINSEIAIYEKKVAPVNQQQFTEILKEFVKNAHIKIDASVFDNITLVANSNKKEFADYDIYKVNIKSFSGKFSEIQEFLTYVEKYDKLVRIDSIKFSKSKVTGELVGSISLSFYFKKLED